MARSTVLSQSQSIGSLPPVSPFSKGGQVDFEVDSLGSKPWRAAPLYRQESFSYWWEKLSASIIAAGKPVPQKKT